MAERITIGLIYSKDENWIAGTYYIENLVSALGTLPDMERPFLKLYCNSLQEFDELNSKTNYPYILPRILGDKNSILDRIVNKFSTMVNGKHWIVRGMDNDVDVIFPNPYSYHFDGIKNKLYWIPDFQEKHFPDFFNVTEIASRERQYNRLVKSTLPIVFSSINAREDFHQNYPHANNITYILSFAVTLPDFSGIDSRLLLERCGLSNEYFICSNQFWKHKNHQVVLKTVKLLMQQGQDVQVAFTGKAYDNRNPEYYDGLLTWVKDNKLENQVRFLGFMDRREQLLLMKNSKAIIQPSLFEGWSTVVEDAKALGHPILLSDLKVHREQLPAYDYFFSPQDVGALAQLMRQEDLKGPTINHEMDVKKFAGTFMKIVTDVIA